VQERMSDISRRVVAKTGLAQSTFNIEFFWDEPTGALNVLEVNARHSQEHAPLFEMVDGVSNHQAMLDVAFGRTPQMAHRAGSCGTSATASCDPCPPANRSPRSSTTCPEPRCG